MEKFLCITSFKRSTADKWKTIKDWLDLNNIEFIAVRTGSKHYQLHFQYELTKEQYDDLVEHLRNLGHFVSEARHI